MAQYALGGIADIPARSVQYFKDLMLIGVSEKSSVPQGDIFAYAGRVRKLSCFVQKFVSIIVLLKNCQRSCRLVKHIWYLKKCNKFSCAVARRVKFELDRQSRMSKKG